MVDDFNFRNGLRATRERELKNDLRINVTNGLCVGALGEATSRFDVVAGPALYA